MIFTEGDGSIWLETRREGMLAPIGHDLRLEARSFRIQISPDKKTVKASVQAPSVTVRAALMGSQERPRALGRLERGRINRTVAKEVLETKRFTTVEFTSTTVSEAATGYALTGQLTIRDVTRSVLAQVVRDGDRLQARLPLSLSDFDIPPVTAFMGALRVRDEVSVLVDLPAPT